MKTLFTNSFHTLLLTVATFVYLASSCKTASSDPDRRDNFVGSWTEKSTNGKAPTAGSADQITIRKSSAKDTYLTVSGLAQKDFDVILNAAGFTGASADIPSGSYYTFSDNSTGEINFFILGGSVSDNELTLTYSLTAESRTKSIRADGFVEVFTKK